jgi:hypothetical protein
MAERACCRTHGISTASGCCGHRALWATVYHSAQCGLSTASLPLTLQELITALDKAQPSDEIDLKYSTLLALTKGCDDVLFIQRLARSCFGR